MKFLLMLCLSVIISRCPEGNDFTSPESKEHKVVFWNVENLFDTLDTPMVNDVEFTPEGPKQWNTYKYNKKMENIEKVLFDISRQDRDFPAIIGVSEVENRNVLIDIASLEKLAPANYKVVHYDSPELRGVDVAFLYRPDVFNLKGSEAITAKIPSRPDFKTRDILTMWGDIEGEPFFFIVVHWSSRSGGQASSEYLRLAAGNQMREIIDSVLLENPATKVVTMGDFNDDPKDKSISQALGAKGDIKDLEDGDLFNPYFDLHKAGYGSLAYRDGWNLFDNIIVSENLAQAEEGELKLLKQGRYYGAIFSRPYMLQKEGNFKNYPLRTYVGNNFQGGFSDHLPVYIKIGK